MPTLNMTDQMTALEIVKRANQPDPFHIIELMRLTNEMLIDVPAYEANEATINKTLQRNVGPMGEHRIYNRGVGRYATVTKVVEDRIAVLEAYSVVDELMLKHSGNIEAARSSEAFGIIKGMGLTQAHTIIYGDPGKADEFAGLFARRNSLTLPAAEGGGADPNVIDAGGTGSNLTSVYLVAVGPDLFHLIYPKGSGSVGVTRIDKTPRGSPTETVKDADGKELEAYRELFRAEYGIAVRAPDALKRICNIPPDISVDTLIDLIIDARWGLPQGASTYAMYSNLDILKKIDKAGRDKQNVIYRETDPWGQPITHIRDVRCRRMDVILNTEEQVA